MVDDDASAHGCGLHPLGDPSRSGKRALGGRGVRDQLYAGHQPQAPHVTDSGQLA